MKGLYTYITEKKRNRQKQLAVLVDPDKFSSEVIRQAELWGADHILVGGSLVSGSDLSDCISAIRKLSSIPITLFPGSYLQIHDKADALLLLSLISGRNPDLLIGNHVTASRAIKASGLEIIPTGYILVEGGQSTSVQYMSNTMPVPADKPSIAVATALAGEQLGLKMIYLEAGSGARNPVSETMIREVKNAISLPLVVGGGITTEAMAGKVLKAGADVLVIGNALERDPQLMEAFSRAVKSINKEHIAK